MANTDPPEHLLKNVLYAYDNGLRSERYRHTKRNYFIQLWCHRHGYNVPLKYRFDEAWLEAYHMAHAAALRG